MVDLILASVLRIGALTFYFTLLKERLALETIASESIYRSCFKIFPGNTDRHTVICHKLNPPIKGRYIRFRPWTWNGKIAMRVELYGFRGMSFKCKSI